jgi:uncharacterized OsmC-like protein
MLAIDWDGLGVIGCLPGSFHMYAQRAEFAFAQVFVALTTAQNADAQSRKQIDIESVATNHHSATNKRNAVAK